MSQCTIVDVTMYLVVCDGKYSFYRKTICTATGTVSFLYLGVLIR